MDLYLIYDRSIWLSTRTWTVIIFNWLLGHYTFGIPEIPFHMLCCVMKISQGQDGGFKPRIVAGKMNFFVKHFQTVFRFCIYKCVTFSNVLFHSQSIVKGGNHRSFSTSKVVAGTQVSKFEIHCQH